jgi:hypothetical protein
MRCEVEPRAGFLRLQKGLADVHPEGRRQEGGLGYHRMNHDIWVLLVDIYQYVVVPFQNRYDFIRLDTPNPRCRRQGCGTLPPAVTPYQNR